MPRFFVLTIVVAIFSISASNAEAHNPILIETPDQSDVLLLETPTISQAMYGELVGFPHMYEFYTKEPMRLFVEVLVPDTGSERGSMSGIILRAVERGRVQEVARLRAVDATWESFYEPYGGDRYLRGDSFDADIEPGLYRIEVSTPENFGKYVLAVGTIEKFSFGDYFALVKKIAAVKVFLGKSSLRAVESPFVYVPLVFFGGIIGLWWYRRKRRKSAVQ